MGSNLVDYRFVPRNRSPSLHHPLRRILLCSRSRPIANWRSRTLPSAPDPTAPNSQSTCGPGSGWTTPASCSVTVTAGGVSVTATATLASVTWTLGEPATHDDTYRQGSPATITCHGAGTAPPASYDWKAQPPCGYEFHWRSLKERTGGTGTWPITATTNWTVTWQSNTGVTGGTTLNATANDQFDIGEYRTVLVQGTGGG